VNEFAPLLDFPTTLMRLRRDHDRFLDLIASVCFLRQYQKQVQRSGGLEYIACDLTDYAVAYRIMVEAVMASTVRELPKSAIMLYDEIRTLVKREAAKQDLCLNEVSITQRQVREATGLGQTWVKYGLRQLVEYEYLLIVSGGGERSKAHYRLRDDLDIATTDLSMIPSPHTMKEKLGKLGKTGQ
jgi:DNA primase